MSPRRLAVATAIVVSAAMGLGGCASSPAEIAPSTSEVMQSTIVTAAEQAAAGDTSAALVAIDSLQAQLEKAIASGDVSASRAISIQQSIDLVRGDLQPAPVVEPAPAETVAPETAVPETSDDPLIEPENPGDKGNGNDGNNGNGNNGNGKGGKGNGGKK